MSTWVQRFEGHPVHAVLRTLGESLHEIEQFEGAPPEALESSDRLRQVVALVDRSLSGSDPIFVSAGALGNIQSHAQQVLNEVQQFRANHAIGHLGNANTHADSLLLATAQLMPARSVGDVDGLREAAASYRKSLGQYHRHVEDESRGLSTSLADLKKAIASSKTEVDSQKARLDSAIADFQRQFSEAEARRVTEGAAAEKERAEKAETQGQEWDDAFTADQEKWTKALAALETDTAARLKTALELGEANSSKAIGDLKGRADGFMQGLETHLTKAQELVYVITNTGMVGGYQRAATAEHRSAFWWRIVAVVSMAGLIGFAIYAFEATLGSSFTWQLFAGRVFVALCFGILGAYGARQADRHENAERSARRIELALASIHPYLQGMPDQLQQEIKREIALRMFTLEKSEDATVKPTKVSGTAGDLLRVALDTINELVKK